jgi:hypothetical protein
LSFLRNLGAGRKTRAQPAKDAHPVRRTNAPQQSIVQPSALMDRFFVLRTNLRLRVLKFSVFDVIYFSLPAVGPQKKFPQGFISPTIAHYQQFESLFRVVV